MKIMLTGDKGFIGKKIKHELGCKTSLAHGKHIQLYGFDQGLSYNAWVTAFMKFQRDVGDLDLIIHCGAVSDSSVRGKHLWQMNYLTTKYLACFAGELGCDFLLFSSIAAVDPVSDYGWSKYLCEDAVRRIIHPDNLCIFRPTNVWGLDEDKKDNPSIVYKIATEILPKMYAECKRDFIHVDDVVRAVKNVTLKFQRGVFEIGTGNKVRISDLVKAIREKVDVQVPPLTVNRPENIPQELGARKDYALPAWYPVDIYDRIDEIVLYIQENRRLPDPKQDVNVRHEVSLDETP